MDVDGTDTSKNLLRIFLIKVLWCLLCLVVTRFPFSIVTEPCSISCILVSNLPRLAINWFRWWLRIVKDAWVHFYIATTLRILFGCGRCSVDVGVLFHQILSLPVLPFFLLPQLLLEKVWSLWADDMVLPVGMVTSELVDGGTERKVVKVLLNVDDRLRSSAFHIDWQLLIDWWVILVLLILLLHLEPSSLYKLHPGLVAEYHRDEFHHFFFDHFVCFCIFGDHVHNCVVFIYLCPELPREVIVAIHGAILLLEA